MVAARRHPRSAIVLPRATTVYQSLGFGCLVLLLPFMQIVRGWIGDRKYVLFESLLDDYDSLPRYNPAVEEFIRHVIAEPEKAVIAEELFQTVGPDSPFADGCRPSPGRDDLRRAESGRYRRRPARSCPRCRLRTDARAVVAEMTVQRCSTLAPDCIRMPRRNGGWTNGG